MPKFTGIHKFLNGETYIEIGEYRSIEDAYDGMERNDSSLTILHERELKEIFYKFNNRNTPTEKLIKITGKAKNSASFKRWQRAKKKELGKEVTAKLVCDNCGCRFVAWIKETLPPCPECGEDEVYEYATV